MKRTIVLFSILVFLFNNISYGENVRLSAESSILIDNESGRVLFGKDPYRKMAMASTTKIMTALVALESGNLDEYVEITEESVGVEGSSIYLKLGEKLKLRDLIYGLMLRSGNDSAMAIAIHISGSTEKFGELMNKRAVALGAFNTNFVNPHGLYDDDHYTTAYDLALITREAFKHEEFYKISAAKSYTSDREQNSYFLNKNKTLWDYEGGDGVKIGYTMKSGRCLVSSAKRDDTRLIAVSLKASNWFNDNYRLMDYGFNNYNKYVIFGEGQFIESVPIKNGKQIDAQLITNTGFSYPLKDDEMDLIKLVLDIDENIEAPIAEGEILGELKVFFDGALVYSTELISRNNIEKLSILDRLINKLRQIPNDI